MPSEAEGRWYINGKDMFTTFGIGISKGSDDFLRFPKKKDSITHDWMDRNGLDVDLSRIFFDAKEVTLDCWILADGEADFWLKYKGFLAEISQPGVQRLTVSELSQSFFVFYKECTRFERPTRIKDTAKVGAFFTIVVVEQEPEFLDEELIIVDDAGRYLTT
jgi:hypothetical protein